MAKNLAIKYDHQIQLSNIAKVKYDHKYFQNKKLPKIWANIKKWPTIQTIKKYDHQHCQNTGKKFYHKIRPVIIWP
jgi:predicted nucleic acid binding AN1-type Zn finger protein